MRKLHNTSLKSVNWWALVPMIIYIIFISYRLFFYAYTDNVRHTMEEVSLNLIPFRTIINYLRYRQTISADIWIYNLAGNIAAFAPLGFFLPAAFGKLQSLKSTFITAFFLILSAETAQLVTLRGVFDVDDIILNTIGAIVGYFIYKLARKVVWLD